MPIDAPHEAIRPKQPKHHTLETGEILYRIYDAGGTYPDPVNFRDYGPKERFDHHRGPDRSLGYAPRASNGDRDPERKVTYTAPSFVCCVAERFFESKTIQGGNMSVAKLRVQRPLRVLDLRGTRALRNGTSAEISKEPDRLVTQAWSRFFVSQPAYGELDGLIWLSRRCDLDTLVFFEHAEGTLELVATRHLTDLSMRSYLDEAQIETGFILEEGFR